ncbi:MAG: vitamin K epoxide reductase family protein [Anaerolineales bacterium]
MTRDETAGAGVNSHRSRTWWLSLGLGAIGLLDSLYLTYIKISGAYAYCGGFGECEVVNQSRFAELWGLPIAAYGAVAYLLIIGLLMFELRNGRWPDLGPLGIFGLTFFGTLFSAYLTYIEIAILQAICPYCVVSAMVMTILWLISMVRLRQSL